METRLLCESIFLCHAIAELTLERYWAISVMPAGIEKWSRALTYRNVTTCVRS